MLNKTVEELMMEVDTLFQKCKDVKELRVRLVELVFDSSHYSPETTFVITISRLKEVFKTKVVCENSELCATCQLNKDCEFICFLMMVIELVIASMALTPEVFDQYHRMHKSTTPLS